MNQEASRGVTHRRVKHPDTAKQPDGSYDQKAAASEMRHMADLIDASHLRSTPIEVKAAGPGKHIGTFLLEELTPSHE